LPSVKLARFVSFFHWTRRNDVAYGHRWMAMAAMSQSAWHVMTNSMNNIEEINYLWRDFFCSWLTILKNFLRNRFLGCGDFWSNSSWFRSLILSDLQSLFWS
jgi:hypothetical protein